MHSINMNGMIFLWIGMIMGWECDYHKILADVELMVFNGWWMICFRIKCYSPRIKQAEPSIGEKSYGKNVTFWQVKYMDCFALSWKSSGKSPIRWVFIDLSLANCPNQALLEILRGEPAKIHIKSILNILKTSKNPFQKSTIFIFPTIPSGNLT